MRYFIRFVFLLMVVAAAVSAIAQERASGSISAQDIVKKWRNATHVERRMRSKVAILVSNSNEDGISGRLEEWITNSQRYRSTTKRDYDEDELVVTPEFAKRRDWNGFVREVQGEELRRLRTEVFEKNVTAFGPPAQMPEAALVPSDDKEMYVVRATPAGGVPITWYISAATWLPVKSVRPGDDSEITTTYDEWRDTDGIITPGKAEVAETDKPEYGLKRISLEFESRVEPSTFHAPKPGAPDTFLQTDAPPIPFTMESSHIVFKVQVNGREPIGFLLDTGADQNVINTPRLAGFGLKSYGKSTTTGGGGSAEYDYAAGATFSLPGVELRNQHVSVLDQTGLERALGVPLGGILGYDFISRFVVEIDYQKNLIKLHDPKEWIYSGVGYIVPVIFDGGIPFTDGAISAGSKKDILAYFVLDFGAAETMTLTSPFVKANDLLRLALTNAYVNRPAGLENQFFSQNNVRGRIDQLTLGAMTERAIPVNMSVNLKGAYASSTFSGTIGESIFRRYHVFLDYARNRIIFEPTEDVRVPFPERRTYGLSIIASGADLHTYTVTGVRPGSQAETDGFKKADVISACKGRPAAEFALGELREWLTHEGESYDITISRGDDRLKIPAQIKLVSLDKM